MTTLPHYEWDDTPTNIHIRLEPGDARLSPWGAHDTVITRKIGDREFQALVPTWAVDDAKTFVVAARVGRVNGKILVYLPVSNEGRPAWRLTDEEFAQVATVEEAV